MYDTETQIKVAQWRARSLAGTITPEEMVQIVMHLSAGRRSAAMASTTAKGVRKASAKIDALNGDDLLNEMLA